MGPFSYPVGLEGYAGLCTRLAGRGGAVSWSAAVAGGD